MIGVQGNSGKASATALAPASLLVSDIPTKNSLPGNVKKYYITRHTRGRRSTGAQVYVCKRDGCGFDSYLGEFNISSLVTRQNV